MMFEIFAKERLIGKVEFVGNLLNIFSGALQKDFNLKYNNFINPVASEVSRELLDDKREILGRKVQLLRIKTQTS